MTSKEAAHIVDVAFGVPRAVRRVGEDRTYHEGEIKEAKDMAIKALEQVPCEDAISRQAAIDAANKVIERDTSGNNDVVNAMIAWSAYIKSLPSVNPQTRTGHWIVHDHGLGCKYYQCSICKGFDRDKKRKYCKWCGAKMVEPQESEG